MKTKLESFETYRGFAALMIAAIHFKVNSPLVNHVFANGFFVSTDIELFSQSCSGIHYLFLFFTLSKTFNFINKRNKY